MDRQRRLKKKRQEALRNKIAALTYYSPKKKLRCSWPGCTVDDLQMLTLDHTKSNGAAHRRQIGRSSTALYRWVKKKKFPKGFRTLCANHNLKKEIQRRIKTRGKKPSA